MTAPRALAGPGPLPGGAGPCSGRCTRLGRRPPAAARAPARLHARGPGRHGPRARPARPTSAPTWCAPIAAATSPTTGPASSSATRSSRCPAKRGRRRHGRHRRLRRSVEQLLIDALADLGLPGAGRLADYPGVWVDPDGDRPPQDRRHRRAAHPGPVDARLRPQRRARHGVLRPHRPVRHRRQGGDVARRPGRRRVACARSSTPSPPGPRRCGGAATRPAGTSCGATGRGPAAFSRGEGPAGRSAATPSRATPADGGGRAARGGVPRRGRRDRRAADRDPQARLAAGRGSAPTARLPARSSDTMRDLDLSRCARRPAAPTSSSAGPTARPRS